MSKYCSRCGKLFESYSRWNKQCPKCYKETHKGNRSTGTRRFTKIKGIMVGVLLLLSPLIVLAQEDCGDSSFMDRLFSDCGIEGNGICEDGEGISDLDCRVDKDNFKDILSQMWFLRFMILSTIILLAISHYSFPYFAASTFILFLYNGAGSYSPEPISDISCNIVNLGECIFPGNSVAGWFLIALIAFILFYYSKQ